MIITGVTCYYQSDSISIYIQATIYEIKLAC